MLEVIFAFIFGVIATVSAPLCKKLITQIITKGFDKASKEVKRWH
jgi:uncharacterized membrane protein YczE